MYGIPLGFQEESRAKNQVEAIRFLFERGPTPCQLRPNLVHLQRFSEQVSEKVDASNELQSFRHENRTAIIYSQILSDTRHIYIDFAVRTLRIILDTILVSFYITLAESLIWNCKIITFSEKSF